MASSPSAARGNPPAYPSPPPPNYSVSANPHYVPPSVGPKDSMTEGLANATAIRTEARFGLMDMFVGAFEGVGKAVGALFGAGKGKEVKADAEDRVGAAKQS